MVNPIEGLSGGHSDSHKKILYAVGGLILIAVIIVAVRSIASSGSGSTGSVGSAGSSGTTSSTDPAQEAAGISNQAATLQEQLQEQLASSEEALSEKNTSFNTSIQEQLTTFNNGTIQTQITNTINDLISGQKAANGLADQQLQATDTIAANNTANILTNFFTHSNGSGLSGSGGSDKNLSISDAVAAFINKNGSSGASFLSTFLTSSQPGQTVQQTPPSALQTYINTTASSLGSAV